MINNDNVMSAYFTYNVHSNVKFNSQKHELIVSLWDANHIITIATVHSV